MSTNPTYVYAPYTQSAFEKYGHQGKFYRSYEITYVSGSTTGELYCTSSGQTYGVGGIITTSGSVGTASLSNGGVVKLENLAIGQIHELSLSYVKNDTANVVYVLIRNPRIR